MPKKIDNVREEILRVAANMFLNENMNDISMRKIATESKIGLGTVYNYFPSKLALLTEVIDMKTGEQFEKIKVVIDNNDNVKEQFHKIYEVLRNDFDSMKSNQLRNVMSTINEYSIEIKEELEGKFIDFHSRVMKYIQEKMNLRSIVVARIFFGAIMWAACDKVDFDEVWKELEKLI